MENENKELMKLSLKLRTFSSHATVMYAKGTDYSILEVRTELPGTYKYLILASPTTTHVHS